MDWLLIACGALMAWVTLSVVAGERTRRQQVLKIRQMELERQAALAARAAALAKRNPAVLNPNSDVQVVSEAA
jgi:hypothetical protein